ncbi:hypothetical protein QNI16_00760 [Cytophagaceae bacterium YF14B1]|uniref:Uncharacterized protein n=1 Tax=Xanthocytophaga flava TaxID=3048013 RepID=A0AAE3QLA4_9BACT|nr:hypothetical protein [Xanthocytophaga flavus]MDJ1466328.1 hypothetical protein [Xanthocytophaga flavus]MDJ1478991.1 hypothetical protein [Xanthocytophaga flavus]
MSDSLSLAAIYESFLLQVYGGKPTTKNGAYASVMANLINKEKGKRGPANSPDAEVQLEKVKEYILLALDKVLKWKMSQSHRDSIEGLKKKTRSARSSSELLEVCEFAYLLIDPNV